MASEAALEVIPFPVTAEVMDRLLRASVVEIPGAAIRAISVRPKFAGTHWSGGRRTVGRSFRLDLRGGLARVVYGTCDAVSVHGLESFVPFVARVTPNAAGRESVL